MYPKSKQIRKRTIEEGNYSFAFEDCPEIKVQIVSTGYDSQGGLKTCTRIFFGVTTWSIVTFEDREYVISCIHPYITKKNVLRYLQSIYTIAIEYNDDSIGDVYKEQFKKYSLFFESIDVD